VHAEQKLLDGGTRSEIRHQAAIVALELLLPPVAV
jgi:nicotinamide-nucleotide amidase